MTRHSLLSVGTLSLGLFIGYVLGARWDRRQDCEDRSQRADRLRATSTIVQEVAVAQACAKSSDRAPDARSDQSSALPMIDGGATASRTAPRSAWQPTPEQHIAMARQRYGELFQELELSQDEVESVLEVLVDQLERVRNARDKRVAPWPLDARNLNAAQLAQNKAEIAAVIGKTKAEALAQLAETVPARLSLAAKRTQLEQAGVPLTAAQRSALEAKVRALEPLPSPPPPLDETLKQSRARFRSFMSAQQQYYRAEFNAELTPAQREQLDALDNMQSERSSQVLGRRAQNSNTAGSDSLLR